LKRVSFVAQRRLLVPLDVSENEWVRPLVALASSNSGVRL
jgi:hypothetical protein